MKPTKTVKVGNQECLVQTLREWLNDRIASIRQDRRRNPSSPLHDELCPRCANLDGRLAEILIIREKINDQRIQEIQ